MPNLSIDISTLIIKKWQMCLQMCRPKWQFNIGYHYARAPAGAGQEALPQLLRVYNYRHQCSVAENYILLKFVLHWKGVYEVQTVLFNYWWSQTLNRILPNCQLGPMYRHYVTLEFRTPSNFGNCHPWDFCLLTRGHFVLSEKTCAVRLRPKSEERMGGGCICPGGEKTQNTSST